MEIIKTVDLHKSFGDLHVLVGVNETIRKGEVVSIIGPSGGGKSTFLRCLNLLEKPEKGQIFFNGEDITGKNVNIDIHRQKMGMVFQQFNVFPHLTVAENITLAPKMLKETSLASTFFLGDMMTSYQIVKGATYLTLEPLTIIATIYLCITYPLSKLVERFEKKMASPNSYRKRKKLNKTV